MTGISVEGVGYLRTAFTNIADAMILHSIDNSVLHFGVFRF